ncbi:MAG: efflux RND transporter permease subunit [Planctomycetota bacterium]|jgi:Cu(I)/Ag(I) efflux system membrane protein CusA/SilA
MSTNIDDGLLKPTPEQRSPIGKLLRFCLENRLIVFLGVLFVAFWALAFAPFDWDLGVLPRKPVPVDAIPDIGENQQIVFAEWPGRSPREVDDQVTYPLTNELLGLKDVKTIRSSSMYGFSSIHVIFDEKAEFYDTRTRLLEKLNSLPRNVLPGGVQWRLGPDATALGQVFWYTLEGRDPDGNRIGGWDLEEPRSIQDWEIAPALTAAEGVAEVASVGGFVREYHVDANPDLMRKQNLSLADIYRAIQASNIDVSAKTIELNLAEYFVRGIGFIRRIEDIENAVVKTRDNVPILVKHMATVQLGPATRRGALDKEGAEVIGGVVVARFKANPLEVIRNIKRKIEQISPSLPTRVVIRYRPGVEELRNFARAHGFEAYWDGKLNQRGWLRYIDATPANRRPKWLEIHHAEDGAEGGRKVSLGYKITPKEVSAFAAQHGFEAYKDGRLDHDAWLKFLGSIPREQWPKWANTSKLTIVPFYDRTGLIYETLGTLEDALRNQILITVVVVVVMLMHLRSSALISLTLPLAVGVAFIAMKLFGVDANIVALSGIAIAIGTIVDMGVVICENILRHLKEAPPELPPLEAVHRGASEVGSAVLTAVLTTVVGFLPVFTMSGPEGKLFKPLAFTKTFVLLASILLALMVLPTGAYLLFRRRPARPLLPAAVRKYGPWALNALVVLGVGVILAIYWRPLGKMKGLLGNLAFVAILVGALLVAFRLFQLGYPYILRWCLAHKAIFLCLPALLVVTAVFIWLGFPNIFSPLAPEPERGRPPKGIRATNLWVAASHAFPGLGSEFMPTLDEGSFLYMPTTMVHASLEKSQQVLSQQDLAFRAIPEVDKVVGKIGRVESPLDPAPISMVETVITYKDEHGLDAEGNYIRQWRDDIRTPDDIWQEIVKAGKMPGVTSAPKLQPIATRLVMLQTGMRAPMGIKIRGPDLKTIENAGREIERLLRSAPGIEPDTVNAERIVAKGYIVIDTRSEKARKKLLMAAERYDLNVEDVLRTVEMAVGGRSATMTVEGRQRFDVRVRYPRKRRDDVEALGGIIVTGKTGQQVPLRELVDIRYERGPQVIKSENAFATGYLTFDKKPGEAEVDVVEQAKAYLEAAEKRGELNLPPGVTYSFTGTYENELHARRTLYVVLPIALFVIFIILYLQFKSVMTTLIVFSGIVVAFAGGFLLIWLYGKGWFLDFKMFGRNMRDLFQVHTINLSTVVWVGFLALFGIATDDGVVMTTYLQQSFKRNRPETKQEVRHAVVAAGVRRVRPCLMTTATTILALLPVLTATGRGSDIMVPMAIPSFGGMVIEILTMLVVPVLYCAIRERHSR